MADKIAYFWFRRDLRMEDNCGLYHALKSGFKIIPVFIFDTEILEDLKDKKDARVSFIHAAVSQLKKELNNAGTDIIILHEKPQKAWEELLLKKPAAAIYTNADYEPYAIKRDNMVGEIAKKHGCSFLTFKNQVIMEPGQVLKDDGTPYTVFTPFLKKWKSVLNDEDLNPFTTTHLMGNFYPLINETIPTLKTLGFTKSEITLPEPFVDIEKISHYADKRDIPSANGTTHLSIHLRFGTVSVRELFRIGLPVSEKWTNELVWREFYMHILFFFPHVVTGAFKTQYDKIEWRNNALEFETWCEGKTGYPIVDAGMRELNETGFMHNRVRMIVSSFLTKHLLIDWRWGEAYFAEKLLDYELSSNNGGWQWAAGCGVDAAPYFRIFNPTLQTQKFDPELKYIRKWVPELNTLKYPNPIVDHAFARNRCLEVYKRCMAN